MIRDLFPGWVPPDKETLDRYWREATVAVDASVLLDLYRFSEQARTGLLGALRSFEERLWIPHQVGLEFHRNRFGVLLAQREAEDTLLSGLDQIKGELLKQLAERLKGAGRRDLAPLEEAIDSGFKRLRESLKQAEKAHTKGLGETIREDPVYDEVSDLCSGRVGLPFDAERQAAVIADAEIRFATKIPPGYLDADKGDDRKYGDVILWHQLCQRAQETGKPVVLVSDDQKEDWVWEVRGKHLGPRPELVAEMQERAGVGFHIYTPTRLLQVWEQREQGREVEPDVLAELEASTPASPVGQGITDLFQQYFQHPIKEQGEALWIAYRGLAAQAIPAHSIEAGNVTLTLEFQIALGNVSPPGALVTVRLPDGSESKARTFPLAVTTEQTGQHFSYSLSYPQHFGDLELPSGNYEVNWELTEGPEKPFGPFQQVARDRFEVTSSRLGRPGS